MAVWTLVAILLSAATFAALLALVAALDRV